MYWIAFIADEWLRGVLTKKMAIKNLGEESIFQKRNESCGGINQKHTSARGERYAFCSFNRWKEDFYFLVTSNACFAIFSYSTKPETNANSAMATG